MIFYLIDILMLFHAFSYIQYILTIVIPLFLSPTPLESQHPLSCLLFSDPEIPIKDAQMCIGVGHLPASGQPTSGHTLEEDPTTTLTSHQLPTAPYLGKEFRSLCLVHAGLLTDMILGMSCLGHHCCCT